MRLKIRKHHHQGSAILVVVMLLAVLAFLPLGSQLVKITHDSTKQNINIFAQADNVARAGLVDAISWFKRQQVQPVRSSIDPITYPYPDAAFNPQSSTDTLTNDTIDSSIGLVKEYQLGETTSLWARYEIKKQLDPETNAYDAHAVHDVTESRVPGYTNGEGLAWYIESVGYVYRQRNPSVAYNVAPNEIVATSRASTEIRRLTISLPVNAAMVVTNRQTVSVQAYGKVTGGNNAGLGYYAGSSGPTISGTGAEVTGTPSTSDVDGPSSSGAISPQIVFGVTETELKLMADTTVNSISSLPAEYPAMAFVYVTSSATFDSSRPLRGGGILYVDGNLTLTNTSNTLFGGLIYATGNLIIQGDTLISGAVVCEGSVTISGSGGVAQVQYDDTILNAVRQQVAQYRENKAVFYTFQWKN